MSTLYSYYNTDDDSNQGFYLTIGWLGQTFLVNTNHIITSVKVKLLRFDGFAGTVTASIKAVDGDVKPTGSDLASGTIDASTVTTVSPGEWKEVAFTTGRLLLAGITYALVMKSSTEDPTKPITWRTDINSPYTDGKLYSSTNQGGSWSALSKDAMFEDYGNPSGSGGGGSLFPTDALTRVTSLIHRYDRGTYTLEMGLGEVISDFGIPLPITTPQKATVKGEEPRIASAKMEAAIKEMQDLLADVKAQGYDYSKGIPQEYFTKKYGEAWAQSAGTPGRVEAMQQYWQATQPGVPLPPSLAPGTEKMEELNIQLGGKYVNGVLTPPSWFTGSATKWVQYIREKATGLTSLR